MEYITTKESHIERREAVVTLLNMQNNGIIFIIRITVKIILCSL